ncbi:MAG: ferritin, partial [Calditrichaeota bacterium]|nr:ferritin [Calditrichota bacterium]
CAAFLRAHAAEEMTHMQRVFDYVLEAGSVAQVGAIDAPPTEFKSTDKLFAAAYAHEQEVTASINALVEVSMQEKDFTTLNFLQWFVSEQREEEALYRSILDKFELIGTDGQGLFFIDREIGALKVGGAPAV